MTSNSDSTASAGFAWVPTLSDTADQPMECRAILVGVAGNIVVQMFDPTVNKLASITIAVQAGMIPIKTKRIYSTSTTATGLVCLA